MVGERCLLKDENLTNLSVSLVFSSGPLDAVVSADDDGDVPCGRLVDVKAFGVEGRLQRLQTDCVFELQVSWRGFTHTELMDELPEAEANPLPGHKVLILNVRSHILREERLITANQPRGQTSVESIGLDGGRRSKVMRELSPVVVVDVDR